jgi:hypothetical protein
VAINYWNKRGVIMFQIKEIKFTPEQLNQHDAEIRKQAKQEVINELLELVKDSDSLKDEIERLKKVNRILVERELKMREERDNAEIELQHFLEKNGIEKTWKLYDNKFKAVEKQFKQERQKVLDELLEWVENTLSIQAFGKTLIGYENIKQKLNEMKGGSNDKN